MIVLQILFLNIQPHIIIADAARYIYVYLLLCLHLFNQ